MGVPDGDRNTLNLVLQAQAGDLDAYERLFERVADRLLLAIRYRLGSPPRLDAFDVLQEVYVRIHDGFEKFEPRAPDSFSHWAHLITRNCIRDLVAHQGAQRRSPGELVRGSAVLARLQASTQGPATRNAEREEQERLLEAMQALDEREHDVLVLRYFEGATLEEAAEATGCSEATVRRLQNDACVKLGVALRGLR